MFGEGQKYSQFSELRKLQKPDAHFGRFADMVQFVMAVVPLVRWSSQHHLEKWNSSMGEPISLCIYTCMYVKREVPWSKPIPIGLSRCCESIPSANVPTAHPTCNSPGGFGESRSARSTSADTIGYALNRFRWQLRSRELHQRAFLHRPLPQVPRQISLLPLLPMFSRVPGVSRNR
jgi:hypothetical protein